MQTTNYELAKRFESRYPKTNYYLQTLLVDTSKLLKYSGKKSFFTGKDKGEKYYISIVKNFGNLLQNMANEYVLTEQIETKEDIFDVLKILFERYSLIFPNWQSEYALLLMIIEQAKETIYTAHKDLFVEILSFMKMQRSKSPNSINTEKQSIDSLIFFEKKKSSYIPNIQDFL